METQLKKIEGLLVEPRTVEESVIAYRSLKMKIEEMELELKQHRLILESECMKYEDFSFRSGLFKVALSEVSRESIDLKTAKKELGEAITPFLKQSNYTMLRVS